MFNDAVAMLISRNLHKKSSEVSIETRSTPALLSFKGQATKHTTVSLGKSTFFFYFHGLIFFHRGNAVIRVLADILRESGKEKVTRIIIATLRVRVR